MKRKHNPSRHLWALIVGNGGDSEGILAALDRTRRLVPHWRTVLVVPPGARQGVETKLPSGAQPMVASIPMDRGTAPAVLLGALGIVRHGRDHTAVIVSPSESGGRNSLGTLGPIVTEEDLEIADAPAGALPAKTISRVECVMSESGGPGVHTTVSRLSTLIELFRQGSPALYRLMETNLSALENPDDGRDFGQVLEDFYRHVPIRDFARDLLDLPVAQALSAARSRELA